MNIKLILMTLVFAIGAYAEGPCAKDKEQFCSSLQPGEGRIVKCLKENEEKVSAECKASWGKMKEHLKEIKEACHDDAQALCPDKEKRELMKCLRSNKEKLSEACKAEIKEAKQHRKGKK